MEVWVLDAGVFLSHSLYIYEQRRNCVATYFYPSGREEVVRKAGEGGQ